MSNTINDGGAAFPMPGADYTEDCGDFKRQQYHGPQQGMSMRDYFAAKAMPTVIKVCASDTREIGELVEDYFARRCYAIADAMLKARTAR